MHSKTFLLAAALILTLCSVSLGLFSEDSFPPKTNLDKLSKDYAWPEGFLDLASDDLVIRMWHPVWPRLSNDIYYFGYNVSAPEDVVGLVKKFAKIKSPTLLIQLRPEIGEPVPGMDKTRTSLEVFVGSQRVIDDWFKTLPDGRIGEQVLKAPPKAVPPTLVLYVGRDMFDLDKLEIPPSVNIEAKIFDDQEKDVALQPAIGRIRTFLNKRAKKTP